VYICFAGQMIKVDMQSDGCPNTSLHFCLYIGFSEGPTGIH